MYRKDNPHQMKFQNFYLPFGGELSGENRWVILTEQIPWHRIEQNYCELFSIFRDCLILWYSTADIVVQVEKNWED